jgi:chromosome segregation ATPase
MKMMEDVQRQIHLADQKVEELRSHKHNLMKRMEQLQTVQARLGAKQRQLQNLECDKLDPELERARCREDAQVQCQATCNYLQWEAMP